MRQLIAAISLFFSTLALALPPQAEADLLMLEAHQAIKAKNYATVVQKLERVAELKVKVPESFPYHYGVALSETGAYERAREQLEKYVTRAGQNGKLYREALEALSRNSTLEAGAKRKTQEDEAAMAKYNEAIAEYRDKAANYQGRRDSRLGKCTRDFDRCSDRVGTFSIALSGPLTGEVCEKWKDKCEREFHREYRQPVQPALPKLNFAESATRFAALPQPTPTPTSNTQSSPAPISSGGSTSSAISSSTQAPSAPVPSALSQDSRVAEKEPAYLANFPTLGSRSAEQAAASLGLPTNVSRAANYSLCPGCRLNVTFYCRSGIAIRGLGDLRNLKIRVGQLSPVLQQLGNLGASPQMMLLTEVGEALQQRILDCVALEELR